MLVKEFSLIMLHYTQNFQSREIQYATIALHTQSTINREEVRQTMPTMCQANTMATKLQNHAHNGHAKKGSVGAVRK